MECLFSRLAIQDSGSGYTGKANELIRRLRNIPWLRTYETFAQPPENTSGRRPVCRSQNSNRP